MRRQWRATPTPNSVRRTSDCAGAWPNSKPGNRRPGMDSETAVWVYAVRGGEAPAPEASGVSGEPVRCVRAAGLTAVVGTVPLAEFGAEALQRNLNDFDWLADTA